MNYEEIRSGAELEASAAIRARVIRARQKQLDRFASSRQMLYTDCEGLCERAITQQGLSARSHDRILKVARTIDDPGSRRQPGAQTHRSGNPISKSGTHILGVNDPTESRTT